MVCFMMHAPLNLRMQSPCILPGKLSVTQYHHRQAPLAPVIGTGSSFPRHSDTDSSKVLYKLSDSGPTKVGSPCVSCITFAPM
jgi:hypothetical protein